MQGRSKHEDKGIERTAILNKPADSCLSVKFSSAKDLVP